MKIRIINKVSTSTAVSLRHMRHSLSLRRADLQTPHAEDRRSTFKSFQWMFSSSPLSTSDREEMTQWLSYCLKHTVLSVSLYFLVYQRHWQYFCYQNGFYVLCPVPWQYILLCFLFTVVPKWISTLWHELIKPCWSPELLIRLLKNPIQKSCWNHITLKV